MYKDSTAVTTGIRPRVAPKSAMLTLTLALALAMSLGHGGSALAAGSNARDAASSSGDVGWPLPAAAGTPRINRAGIASVYGDRMQGRPTSSGQPYDRDQLTAAHRTLPFGTRVKVTNLETSKSVVVRINDRGPHVAGRIIDVSASAAKRLGMPLHGLAKVRLEVLAPST
jgi:rare lipoprotein A